jgi:hypothetical protein
MSLTIKNYKKLESWSHNYKEFMIGEVTENQNEYCFRVGYNGIPYTLKIFRQGTITNEYEMVLRDGADITQYGREWIAGRKLKSKELTALIFEALIVKCKPKAQQTTGNTNYSNGPF